MKKNLKKLISKSNLFIQFGLLIFLLTIFLPSCTKSKADSRTSFQQDSLLQTKTSADNILSIKQTDFALVGEIPLPKNFKRIPSESNSFTSFLRNIKIDKQDNVVHLYNGNKKPNQEVHFAIFDIDVGNRDLQQCADAVMRLRGEYLFHQNQPDEISFLFTNGDRVYFKQWAQGYRPRITGNKVVWSKKADVDYSYNSFRKFMDLIFTYAGTLSLSQELEKVSNFEDILPGDVIIIGGSPGHAVIVVDMAKHIETDEKIFMIAQSYMPAQEIHILKNMEVKGNSPWYSIPEGNDFNTPEYYFTKNNLMRFSNP